MKTRASGLALATIPFVGVCLATILFANVCAATSLEVAGRVTDARTGQPLSGAAVILVGTDRGRVTDADGDFRLTVDQATARVRIQLIGYRAEERELTARDPGAPPEAIALEPVAIPVAGAEVSSHLAGEGKSPVAFTTLERKEIERSYWGQDVPILLAEVPGAYAYSDAGNGIGYSYLKLRGFGQRRIGVTINGIPLNDPESREVYWIDHPDLVASARSIQIQRGVGATAYGTTALGGSVNVETLPFLPDRHLVLEAGAGSFGTQRYSVQAGSGLLDGRYAMQARLSRILTDGYRDQSWSDLWSYFLGLARVDPHMVTRLNFYGGPEETHLAYLGVPRAYLDGAITGDADRDRRANPLTFRNERDHFFEPHYEFIHDWKLSEATSLSNALFYFPGKGYYDEFREDRDLREYNVPDSIVTDVVRRRWVKNIHVGWVPRLRHVSGDYELTIGLDLRYHEGRHWGELLWAAEQPANPEPNHVYYDYLGRVFNSSAFVRQAWSPMERVRLTGDLALHRQRYELAKDHIRNQSFAEVYDFLTPRAGVNVVVRDAPQTSLSRVEAFASFSRANAEPIFRELYDPENAGAIPAFRQIDPSGRLRDPIVQPERVFDYEAGVRARGPWGEATLGGYYMDFENEIVYNGQLDDNGNPITANAARSRHAGIEASAAGRAGRHLEMDGAFHWSRNRFKRYLEFYDATTFADYSGNAIAGFPDLTARGRVLFRRGGSRVEVGAEHVGRQFLDNTENERKDPAARTVPGYVDKTIEPYTVARALIGHTWPALLGLRSLDLSFRVENLFDERYETAGYIDFPAPDFTPTPVWIPAATRSFLVGIRASF